MSGPRRSNTAPLRIGLVYDLLGTDLSGTTPAGSAPDADAEYEPPETVDALEAAVRRAGHEAVRIGRPHELLAALGRGTLPPLDAAWNIAEGFGPRNREAWAPVLLEMAGVPTLGSDALTQSLSLDKAWTLDVAAAAGVRCTGHVSLTSPAGLEITRLPGPFPLFVKPRWEGTAKGIGACSRVEDAVALAAEVERIVTSYGQPALVEPFLPGAEYTVALLGNDPPRALPVLQRALERESGVGLHALERDGGPELAWALPGELTDALEEDLAAQAQLAFKALHCRDFARVDFKLDHEGVPRFLEINPLPTFAPDGTFAILAEMDGRPYEDLLAEVLGLGLRRLGLAR
jgi:D-alanine-D-alanine ligase